MAIKNTPQELYDNKISPTHAENTIKKTTAKINFGLLEKPCNKDKKSHVFESLCECGSYQVEEGGTISVIEQIATERKERRGLLDGEHCVDLIDKPTSRTLNVLTTTATTKLCDGSP